MHHRLTKIGILAWLGAALTGCGDNPCQDVNAAIDAARMKPMCSDFIAASSDDGLDPSSCTVSDNQAKIIEAEVTCYQAVAKCDIPGQISLNDCLAHAMSIGASN